jgi:hypothetical protein
MKGTDNRMSNTNETFVNRNVRNIPTNRMPYVIAATGHRDLGADDLEPLRTAVKTILSGMRKRMPNTPLILLDGLAEGADQLIAQVALEEGVSVIATLPMPIEIYRETMSESAQVTLTTLMNECLFTVEMKNPGNRKELISRSEATKAECYEELGRYLASNCQALIALWDGEESGKKGGTDSVVRFVREGLPGKSLQAEETKTGVVYQIITRRERAQNYPSGFHETRVLCREDKIGSRKHKKSTHDAPPRGSEFALLEMHIEQFNNDLRKSSLIGDENRLVPVEEMTTFDNFPTRVETLFQYADNLAVTARAERDQYFWKILGPATIGALGYILHVELWDEYVLSWLILPVFLVIAVILHDRAKKTRVEQRYLDYRALAEALRVQFFWELSGIEESVADYYLRHYREETDWIHSALHNLYLLREKGTSSCSRRTLDIIQQYWVSDQMSWYQTKAKIQQKQVIKRARYSKVALWTVIVLSSLIPLILWPRTPWPGLIKKWLTSNFYPPSCGGGRYGYGSLHIFAALIALLAGVYRLRTEQQAYEEQAREYERTGRVLKEQLKRLQDETATDQKRIDILLEVGKEALIEHGRWLLLHRERPLEVTASA